MLRGLTGDPHIPGGCGPDSEPRGIGKGAADTRYPHTAGRSIDGFHWPARSDSGSLDCATRCRGWRSCPALHPDAESGSSAVSRGLRRLYFGPPIDKLLPPEPHELQVAPLVRSLSVQLPKYSD